MVRSVWVGNEIFRSGFLGSVTKLALEERDYPVEALASIILYDKLVRMCAGVLRTSCCRYVPVTSSQRWISWIRIAELLLCRVVDPTQKELIYERAASLSYP